MEIKLSYFKSLESPFPQTLPPNIKHCPDTPVNAHSNRHSYDSTTHPFHFYYDNRLHQKST